MNTPSDTNGAPDASNTVASDAAATSAPAATEVAGTPATIDTAAATDPANPNTAAADETLTAASLSEFDFYALIDASGSMGNPSRRFADKTLWGEAEELVLGLTRACAAFDEDGIDIITFAGQPRGFSNVVPEKVHEVFQQVSPMGSTNTHLALQLALDMISQRNKKAFVIVFTDGQPNDQGAVKSVIINAVNTLENEHDLTFLFIQIGQDPGAAQFLDDLDDNLVSEGAKFDCVDCINSATAEQLTPAEMLTKAMND